MANIRVVGRKIFFFDEINRDTAMELMSEIANINDNDDYVVGEREPIHLYLDSDGGAFCNAFAIANFIKNSKSPIYTYNAGMVASAAVILFITGEKRFALEGTSFLIHRSSSEVNGMVSRYEMLTIIETNERYEEKYFGYIKSKTKITDKDINKKLGSFKSGKNRDWIVGDTEAVELGIAQDILRV